MVVFPHVVHLRARLPCPLRARNARVYVVRRTRARARGVQPSRRRLRARDNRSGVQRRPTGQTIAAAVERRTSVAAVTMNGGGGAFIKVPEVRVNDQPATLLPSSSTKTLTAAYNNNGGGGGGGTLLLTPGVAVAVPRRRHSWICG